MIKLLSFLSPLLDLLKTWFIYNSGRKAERLDTLEAENEILKKQRDNDVDVDGADVYWLHKNKTDGDK